MHRAWIMAAGRGEGEGAQAGPDGWIRVLQGLVILCWGGFVALLSLYHFARPEVAYGFLVYGGVKVRQSWDPCSPLAGARALGLLPADPGGAGAGPWPQPSAGRCPPRQSLFILLLILVACLLLYYRG